MPNFQLVPQKNATFRTVAWTDPPSDGLPGAVAEAGGQAAWDALTPEQQAALLARHPTKPSRVTASQGRQHFAWQVDVNTAFQVWCQPDGGAAGDPDTMLGGRLFDSWFAESPELPLGPSYSVGYTGRVYYTAHTVGHVALVVRRKDGGAVALHIDVVDPTAPLPP